MIRKSQTKSKFTRIPESSAIYATGDEINFLAQGHKIKHASGERQPNVLFAEVSIDEEFLPQSFLSYIPSHRSEERLKSTVMGVFTIDAIKDNTELFVDFWDNFDVDKENRPAWMTVPNSPLNELYFMKKGYENEIKYFTTKALGAYLPAERKDKLDIEKAIDHKLQASKELETRIEDKNEESKKIEK